MISSKKDFINIYLVDDDELHLRILLNKFNSTTNYNIHTFQNGEELLETLVKKKKSKKSIDIIILDYLLSVNGDHKNGVEILKIIKEIYPEYEVIMLSGKGDIDTAISAMHHGALTFIEKSENSFPRLNNSIKWIVSEKRLKRRKQETIFSTKLFVIILLILLISSYIIYLFFPEIF